MKNKFLLTIIMTIFIVGQSLAAEITVYGRGGIRGSRVCPRSCAACLCATIKSFTGDVEPGAIVDVDVFSINGSLLWNGSGVFIGLAPQGADVDFGGEIIIDDPNDPNP